MARTKQRKKSNRQTSPKSRRNKAGRPSKRWHEVKGVFFAGILVYILLSVFGADTGKIGAWTAATGQYLLGSGTIIVIALLFLEVFRIFRGLPWKVTPKRLGFLLLVLVFQFYLHLSSLTLEPLAVVPLSWREVSAGVSTGTGGGMVGAFLTFICLKLFDVVGTYVVLIFGSFIGIILILDKTMRQLVGQFFRLIYKGARGIVYGLGYLFWLAVHGVQNLIEVAFVTEEDEIPSSPAQKEKKEREVRKKPSKGEPKGHQSSKEAAVAAESAISINAYQGPDSRAPKLADGFGKGSTDGEYNMPPLDLLLPPEQGGGRTAKNELVQLGRLLEETLANFGIEAKVVHIDCGPVITRYELQPAPGIKVSRIVSLADDIALSLAAEDIRIEAPIPGKAAIGIEIPNKRQEMVRLSEVIATSDFNNERIKVPLVLGKGVAGEAQVVDLSSMPHLLIAGATGSGKSVCMNNFIISLLYRLRPDQLRILMVDPKRVELAVYDGIPHLLAPVITDPKKAAAALKWVVEEMENRYELFADAGVRNIEKYNEYVEETLGSQAKRANSAPGEQNDEEEPPQQLPYVVVLIDELADLMMVASSDVEDAICRLAQMARAAGIHLVVATQRPSVDVITGLIKANIPARIAFAVSSQVDSRTILDSGGAERLIGKGDMLYLSPSSSKTIRVQGAYVSDKEIESVAEFWKRQGSPEYEKVVSEHFPSGESGGEVDDELFDDAMRLVVNSGQASISLLQRRFRIGHSRAARLMDMMELKGIVGPYQGSKPRDVLVTSIEQE